MTPISVTAEIDRPQAEVFSYVTDPSRFHEWRSGLVAGCMANGATGVGSRCTTTRRIGGSERVSTSQVTTFDPPSRWGVRGIDGPIRAIVDVRVEPVTASRSRTTIAVDFEGHGIGRLLVPLVVRRQAHNEVLGNAERLKERLCDWAVGHAGAPGQSV